jgi:hypothetical protein
MHDLLCLPSGSWRFAPIYQKRGLFFVREAFSLDDRPPAAEKAAPTKIIYFLGESWRSLLPGLA